MPPACKISIHTKPRDYYRHMSNTLLCYFVLSDVHRNQCVSQHRTHKGMSIKKALNNSCQPNKNGKNLPEVFGNWSLSFNSKRHLALLLLRLLHCASFRGAPNHVKPCSLSFKSFHPLPSIEWEEGLCPVLHEESCSKRLQICSPCPWSVDQPQAWQKKARAPKLPLVSLQDSLIGCTCVSIQNTISLILQSIAYVQMVLNKIECACVLVKYAHGGKRKNSKTL